jgi:protein phosphatase PTC6
MFSRLCTPYLRLIRTNTSARRYHDYTRFSTPGGIVRVPLNSPKVIGAVSSRGSRSHQEDYYAFATLSLSPESLAASVKKQHGLIWDPSSVSESLAREVTFVGIYDGHGGSAVSQYLRQELHGIFESVDKSQIPELYEWIRELGGYFKRFRGGALAPWIDPSTTDTPILDLQARATQAFFEVDRNLSSDEVVMQCGATASVAILHSLDSPSTPFYASSKLSVTVAHCG